MTTVRATLHFGILNPSPDRDQRLTALFQSDGDSFLIWGEGHGSDNTLHVLVPDIALETYSAYNQYNSATIRSLRRMLNDQLQGDERLFDYVVVTNKDTWSEDHSVWTPIEGDLTVIGTTYDN